MTEHNEEQDVEERKPYMGEQRFRDLQDDEETELEAGETSEQNQETEESLSVEEQTYRKRYGDLRTHVNTLSERHREETQKLQSQIDKLSQKEFKLPKSEEELTEFAERFPDVYKVVESVALKYANEATKSLEKEVGNVRQQALVAAREKAEAKLMKMHPDFDEIRQDPAFHEWVKVQPSGIQDSLYRNDTDFLAASRSIDLYKADVGITKAKPKAQKEQAKDAARRVPTSRQGDVASTDEGVIKESDVARMTQLEYEQAEDRIFKAIRSGKFVYDQSGAAR